MSGNPRKRLEKLAPLMHLQLRVLQKTEFEKRLARVERQLRESIGSRMIKKSPVACD